MSEQLLARIEKLEKQNRKMKVAMTGLCLCLGALFIMGQVSGENEISVDRIEAKEIVLNSGTASAALTPDSLIFSSEAGPQPEKSTVTASSISLGGRYSTEIRPESIICSLENVPRFDLSVREIGASIAFRNPSGLMGTMLDESTMVLINDNGTLSMRPEQIFLQKGEADALLASSSLRIRDADQYQAILGQTDQTTSGTRNAAAGSAASIVLLGKDESVAWQAP